MPFCESCGVFEPNLNNNRYCLSCYRAYQENPEVPLKMQFQFIQALNKVNFRTMFFFQELISVSNSHKAFFRLREFSINNINTSNNINQVSHLNQVNRPQNSRLRNRAASNLELTNIGAPPQMNFSNYPRSSMSLIFMLIGLLMPLIIGIPLEIAALIMGSRARRYERANWVQRAGFGGSIFILVILLLGFIAMPDIFLSLLLMK